MGHLLREIESALRDVLQVVLQAQTDQDREGANQGRHKADVLAILRGLDIPETDGVAQAWLRLCDRREGLYRKAHRQGLDLPRPLDSAFREFWDEMEGILDVVLDRLEARYARVVAVLDELLKKQVPTAGDIERLAQNVPNNVVARGYFFDRLESDEWLVPLKKAGFFRRPPEPELDLDGQGYRLPRWAESCYLARHARERPGDVLETILEAEETTNAGVHADFIDAAIAMPPELAARLAPKVAGWLRSTIGVLLLTDKVADLVVHLAARGQSDSPLELAGGLLALSPSSGTGPAVRAEPRPLFEKEFYGDVLEKVSPALTAAAGERWLTVLCDLLCDAVRFSVRAEEGCEAPEDRSHWWRPAIEDHEQNEPLQYVRDGLVDAVRTTAEQLVARDPSSLRRVVTALEARPWKLFRRVALHVLRRQPAEGQDLIRERLTKREYFEDLAYHHEYYLLSEEQFSRLETAAQNTVLQWIAEGPDREKWTAGFEERHGRQPTDDEWKERLDRWRFTRLLPLRHALTTLWKERYEQLAAQVTQPRHPDFLMHSSGGVWSGFPSPKAVADLRTMSNDDLVRFLADWEPSSAPLGASPEGLGLNLTALVIDEPERFAAAGARFQGLDPTYVRAVLDGLTQAIEKKRQFGWPAVLQLCQWAVAQPRDRVDRRWHVHDADPDWGWARKAMARLLGKGLEHGEMGIPFELRAQVWGVLEALLEDPEPTPAYEAEYGGSNMDPATLSINTVRGDALHSVVRYGLWVRNNVGREPDAQRRLARGFDEMPELRAALERHLDPEHDPSLAIRAVYGQWFAWLALLDEAWVSQKADQIFPQNEEAGLLWDAAWNTYVGLSNPYDNTFPRLAEQYRHAVELLGSRPNEAGALPRNPEERLAEHLMSLHWRSRLEMGDTLFRRFYERASPELRGHAIEFVGRSLINTDGQVPEQVLQRLQALWDWRLSHAQRAGDPSAFGPELAGFGWWFRSAKFDDGWAIAQLKRSLQLGPWARREAFVVMERLAQVAASMPAAAVECATLLLDSDAEHFAVIGHRKELHQLLRAALRGPDVAASRGAQDLVNRLVARGHIQFRDLLTGA